MESTNNFQHHEQEQQQQQQHLQDHFVGCSPLINQLPSSSVSYGVSTSLQWNPCILSSTTSSANTFCNKLYEDESSNSSLITTISPSLKNSVSNNFGYESSNNYPKIEENMLSSFPSFTSLINSPSNMMENSCSFNGFGAENQHTTTRGFMQFPLDHKEQYQSPYDDRGNTPIDNNWITGLGFPSTNILHQLGLVSSPNNSTTSVSSSSPRLGLNMQAMDLLGNSNANFGSHVLHEEGISSSIGKITPKAIGQASNGVAGTKRAAGDCSIDRPKASASNNNTTTTPSSKKSQLKLSCPPLKVRKEKLGDRIAALHQMVSPFGKTDTASVLTEAIGYIQFLQDQIHTLCMPHAKPSRNKLSRSYQMGEGNEDDGKDEDSRIDIRRRGLCLVPVSWTSFITPNHMDASNSPFF